MNHLEDEWVIPGTNYQSCNSDYVNSNQRVSEDEQIKSLRASTQHINSLMVKAAGLAAINNTDVCEVVAEDRAKRF